jgi:ribosome assembly protein YihI (activator of Der GTPase)
MAKGKAVGKLKQKAGNRTGLRSGTAPTGRAQILKKVSNPRPPRIGSKKALPKKRG